MALKMMDVQFVKNNGLDIELSDIWIFFCYGGQCGSLTSLNFCDSFAVQIQ